MKKLSLFVLMVAFLFGMSNWGHAQSKTPSIPHLTVAEYKANPDKIFVVMFFGAGCGPCIKAKDDLLVDLSYIFSSEKYNGKVGVYLVNLTTGFPSDAPAEWKNDILYFPTFRVLYNGANLYTEKGYSTDKKNTLKRAIMEAVDAKI